MMTLESGLLAMVDILNQNTGGIRQNLTIFVISFNLPGLIQEFSPVF